MAPEQDDRWPNPAPTGSGTPDATEQKATAVPPVPTAGAAWQPPAGVGLHAEPKRTRGSQPSTGAATGLRAANVVPLTTGQEETALILLRELIAAAASRPAPNRLTFPPANGLIRFRPAGSDLAPPSEE